MDIKKNIRRTLYAGFLGNALFASYYLYHWKYNNPNNLKYGSEIKVGNITSKGDIIIDSSSNNGCLLEFDGKSIKGNNSIIIKNDKIFVDGIQQK